MSNIHTSIPRKMVPMPRAYGTKQLTCSTHKPLNLGYMAWHLEAERRTKRNQKQKQCPHCGLWFFKDEM